MPVQTSYPGVYIEEREVEQVEEEPTDDSGDAEASFVDPDRSSTVETSPGFAPEPDEFCYSWAPEITRSVIIDGDLYTISEAGVGVNDFDSLRDVAWIPFQR